MRCKALLLAGGIGTRLKPLTETTPKCLVPIAGKPLLAYWLESLERAGIENALINTHHLAGAVRTYISVANASRSVTLKEAFEPELLGSAGTVHANRSWADDAEHVVIIYADNLSDVDLAAMIAKHKSQELPMTMMLFHAPNPSACGIATLDKDGSIVKFEEKPENPESNLANAGIYVLDSAAWREIADMDRFDFGFDVIGQYVGRMHGYVHEGYHRDIGTPEALAAAEADAKRFGWGA